MLEITAPLFVPGDRPERFGKAAQSGADAVIIDLEDAVAPHKKDEARANAREHRIPGVPVIIRLNALGSPWLEDDLRALSDRVPVAVMLPKCESADAIRFVRSSLGGTVYVLPLIETVRGLAHACDILSVEGVACAAFGSLDYALDLGCAHEWEALLFARCTLVFASRVAGVAAPLDGVTTTWTDQAELNKDATRAAELGFGGKLLVHPSQVSAARRAFSPSDDMLSWARHIVEVGSANAGGAIEVDGRMVDEPVLRRARQVLLRHSALQKSPSTPDK